MIEPDAAPAGGRPWLRGTLRAALVFIVVGAGVTGRAVLGGEREIAQSTAALEAGDAYAAADHARAAASWHVPGAPHVRVAYGRLMALGRAAEERHLRELALHSYRAVVTASASTEWIVVPHARDAEAAKAAIARLESTAERPIGTATEPRERVEARLLSDLAAQPGPSRLWSAVLAASFIALATGVWLVLARAVDESGRLHRRPALPGAVVGAAGLLGYALALWLA